MNELTTVLLADPDNELATQLDLALPDQEFFLLSTPSGREALQWYQRYTPQIVVTNLLLSDIEGLDLIQRMQELPGTQLPHIIVISNHPEEYTEIAAFQHGADDYLHQPVKIRPLVKRLQAVMKRRQEKMPHQVIQVHEGFTIDINQYLVFQQQVSLSLPKKEFQLLHLLAQSPYRVFSREELLESIWESDVLVVARTVDVHILKIRQKIGSHYIETLKGSGYRFIPEPKPITI